MGTSSLCSYSSRVFRISIFFSSSNEEISVGRDRYFFEGMILYLESYQTGRLLHVCHPKWSDSVTVEDGMH